MHMYDVITHLNSLVLFLSSSITNGDHQSITIGVITSVKHMLPRVIVTLPW